ncbi:MAG: hypothetical protein GX595_14195 [Lentisphaerae bacterium]|nr:hypothetical protein [Lentisphaerota bacterium]
MSEYIHTYTGTVHRPGAVVGGVQTHARMSAAAWAALGCVPYTAPPPEPPPNPAVILAARAAEVLANPDAVEAVQAVLARVGEVAAAGVAITDWSYQGVAAAIEGAMTGDASHDLALMRHGMALRTAWDRVIYHAGTMQTAQELWPAMVAAVQSV